MRALAFYLPQYHATAENDAWWGPGFTEWDNVRAAKPCFPGHYQPHVPHPRLGYYDLADPASVKRQHDLARRYGIYGFCYYYYNFSGRTLLEKPLRIIRESPEIRNPFCLCWANHDWTRAWYGQSKEVLIRQEYNPENALKVFAGLLPYLLNPRYIRIESKPLLLVFNPEHNPLMPEYSGLWRELARKSGLEGLFLAGVESLRMGVDPALYGFDAAVEFAPDWSKAALVSAPEDRPRIYDYQATLGNMLTGPEPGYTRLRCLFPGWDNTPRYKKAGLVFENCTLGAFKYALESVREYTAARLPESLRYVFFNAWNEWGEGCHLEPDLRRAFEPLEIIRQAFS
jgi:hypothetical protein